MMRFGVLFLSLGCLSDGAATALEAAPVVPSGATIWLHEVRSETTADDTAVLRLRYVMPSLVDPAFGFAQVADDFLPLCLDQAVPYMAAVPQPYGQVIVSFSAQPVALGVSQPEVIQYFELFTVENDTCIWEAF